MRTITIICPNICIITIESLYHPNTCITVLSLYYYYYYPIYGHIQSRLNANEKIRDINYDFRGFNFLG